MARFPLRKGKQEKKDIVLVGSDHAGKHVEGREEMKRDILQMLRAADRIGAANIDECFTETLAEFDGVVEEKIVLGGADVVIVFGGDGTLQQLLKRLIRYLQKYMLSHPKPPVILFLGLGTQNIVLQNFGLVGPDPRVSVAKFIKRLQHGIEPDLLNRMVMLINGEEPGFTCGSGLTANLLEKYSEKKPGGPRRILKVALWTLMNETLRTFSRRRRSMFERFHAEVKLTIDGVERKLEKDTFTGLLTGTVPSVGFNCKALPRAIDDPAAFQMRLINLGFKSFLPNIWPLFVGMPLLGDVEDQLVSKAVIRYERPMTHMIDGEITSSLGDTVTIETGPYLKFIRC